LFRPQNRPFLHRGKDPTAGAGNPQRVRPSRRHLAFAGARLSQTGLLCRHRRLRSEDLPRHRDVRQAAPVRERCALRLRQRCASHRRRQVHRCPARQSAAPYEQQAMIHVRRMTAADVPLGMRLKEQAGWNQMEADWRRCLHLEPEGCFVAEFDRTPVGTTTTCVFGNVAWIAMVLVDAGMRGRGIGKALVHHALTYLDSAGVPRIRLDATPLGQPLYEKLGFREQFQLARFEGVLTPRDSPHGLATAAPDQWAYLIEYDAAATRTNRGRLLESVFAARPDAVRCMERGGAISGFLAVRQGSRA